MTALNPESILIVRPSALGDVCRTVPVLVTLRTKWPEARIGCSRITCEAVSAHPSLDELILPRSRMRSAWVPETVLEVLRFLRMLKGGDWDLVLDCQGLARSLFSRLRVRGASGSPKPASLDGCC